MKVKATYKGCNDEKSTLSLIFSIPRWMRDRIGIEKEGQYIIDIKPYRKNRTLEQNAMLWELLTQIDEKVNGTRKPWNWYVLAIKQTGIKTKIIYLQDESLEELKQMCMDTSGTIRAVESLGRVEDLYAYRIYYGSSTFDTKEMSLLIDTVLDMAQLVGIDRLTWEDMLK